MLVFAHMPVIVRVRAHAHGRRCTWVPERMLIPVRAPHVHAACKCVCVRVLVCASVHASVCARASLCMLVRVCVCMRVRVDCSVMLACVW